jgi:hypothetical protein
VFDLDDSDSDTASSIITSGSEVSRLNFDDLETESVPELAESSGNAVIASETPRPSISSSYAETSAQGAARTALPPTSLFSVMPNATPANILSISLSISDALEALNAAKPNHRFLELIAPLQQAGYEYLDEVAKVSAKQLAEEVDKLTMPAARELHTFATAQLQYQYVISQGDI